MESKSPPVRITSVSVVDGGHEMGLAQQAADGPAVVRAHDNVAFQLASGGVGVVSKARVWHVQRITHVHV